jgi:hypothetical protein
MMVTADDVISDVESGMVRDEELDNDFSAELSMFGTALVEYGSLQRHGTLLVQTAGQPFGFEDRCRMAHLLNRLPKMVFSLTEKELGWENAELVLVKDDRMIK